MSQLGGPAAPAARNRSGVCAPTGVRASSSLLDRGARNRRGLSAAPSSLPDRAEAPRHARASGLARHALRTGAPREAKKMTGEGWRRAEYSGPVPAARGPAALAGPGLLGSRRAAVTTRARPTPR